MTPFNQPKPDTSTRVFRGGGLHYTSPAGVRAANRCTVATSFRYYYVGFRCALRSRAPR